MKSLALRLWDEKSGKLTGYGPVRQRRRELRDRAQRSAHG